MKSSSGQDKAAIGIDLGGTKVEIALVDSRGRVGRRVREPTETKEGYVAVKDQIVRVVRQILKEIDFRPEGIGIGVAGQVEPETGAVSFAPNLNWTNAPLRADLADSLGLPVFVTNDVRAVSWGEWLYGAGKGCNDLVAVFVGTGIGGGVIVGGRVLSGCSNTLGEIGHITVDFHGPACTCGNQGCLEAFAGGWAIGKAARDALDDSNRHEGEMLLRLSDGGLDGITAETVIQALRQGDPLSKKIMHTAVEALIAGSVSIVNAFNPCRLILGGGVVDGYPELIGLVEAGVRKRALKAATERLHVMKAELGGDAGVVGAAAFAMNSSSGGSQHAEGGEP